MAVTLRVRSTEFDATRVLLPQEFHRLQALLSKSTLTADEQKDLIRLKLLAYLRHEERVTKTIDEALNGTKSEREVDELVSSLFE